MSLAEITSSEMSFHKIHPSLRMNVLPRFFGVENMALGESLVYSAMEKLWAGYSFGSWDYYLTSNGAFFMVPSQVSGEGLSVSWPYNSFEGVMTGVAAGIVCTLYSLHSLVLKTQDEKIFDIYERLEDFAFCHPESAAICRARD